jgi:hypothetical protein
MGNIYRKVTIFGLTTEAKRLGGVTNIEALIDHGASMTVISTRLARRLKGRLLKGMKVPIEGRKVPVKLTALTLHAEGCGERPLVVAVDDDLVGRAGTNHVGAPTEIILGHDYLEGERVGARYTERGDDVVCHAAPLASLAGVTKTRRRK